MENFVFYQLNWIQKLIITTTNVNSNLFVELLMEKVVQSRDYAELLSINTTGNITRTVAW